MRWTVVLAVMLAACGDDEVAEDGEGGDAPLAFVFASEADVAAAYEAMDLPYLFAFAIAPDPSVPTECPRVTLAEDGRSYTAEGGCTDALGGRWMGSVAGTIDARADHVSYSFTYRAFGVENPGGQRVIADGTVRTVMRASEVGFPAPAVTAERLALTMMGGATDRFEPGFTGGELVYTGYSFAWDGAIPPGFTARATVEHKDRGTYTFDAAWTADECELPTEGSILFRGDNAAAVIPDATCDGCAVLQVDGAPVGEICSAN